MKNQLPLLIFFLISISGFAQTPDNNGIIYVNINKQNGTGNSWDSPTRELADALKAAKTLNAANAGKVTQIWVAKGTYKPLYSPADNNFGNADGRNNAFRLVNDVKLYGGFPDIGTPGINDRSSNLNPTILSGDIGRLNNSSDNVYHVVIAVGTMGTAGLDGFTVTGAFGTGRRTIKVNSKDIEQEKGGGMVVYEANLIITNCKFLNNIAATWAGGLYINSASPQLDRCIFTGNDSQSGGAVLIGQNSSPTISNSLFYGNIANYGSEIQNYDLNTNSPTTPTFINCTFYNTSTNSKIYNDGENTKPKIYNSIIWGGSAQIENTNGWPPGASAAPVITNSIVQGGSSGTGNIDQNPLFTDAATGDFTLQTTSPAIDRGNNELYEASDGNTGNNSLSTDKDLAGYPRISNDGGVIDIGAYEYQGNAVLSVTLTYFIAKVENNATVLRWETAAEKDNARFEVLRSTDALAYASLGTIAGQGTTSTKNSYTFHDPKPLNATNYYKLVQKDIDGKTKELGVRLLTFGSKSEKASLYPNPVREMANIRFTAGKYQNITLTDINGKILQQLQLNPTDLEKTITTAQLPTGTYFLTLQGYGAKTSITVIKK